MLSAITSGISISSISNNEYGGSDDDDNDDNDGVVVVVVVMKVMMMVVVMKVMMMTMMMAMMMMMMMDDTSITNRMLNSGTSKITENDVIESTDVILDVVHVIDDQVILSSLLDVLNSIIVSSP